MEVVLGSPPASLPYLWQTNLIFTKFDIYFCRIYYDLLDDGAFCARRVASLQSGIKTLRVQLLPFIKDKM
jgi:hypothetical protein